MDSRIDDYDKERDLKSQMVSLIRELQESYPAFAKENMDVMSLIVSLLSEEDTSKVS